MDVLADLDLDQIADPTARRVIPVLLNLIEDLHAEHERLRAENQQLRDELARLAGGSGRPTLRPQVRRPAPTDRSSERERRVATPRQPRSKLVEVTIHRVESLAVDPALLPRDAEFKGYEEVIIQALLIEPRNTCFRKAKWYSPSTRQTYLAPLPPGYHGQFGPGVKALVLALYDAGELSEPKLVAFLRSIGVQISDGTLAGWLIHEVASFHAEAAAVTAAGLASSPWQHLDDTATRVDGQNRHCFVLANPLFTRYLTRPRKDRQTVVEVLRDGRPRTFLLDATAQTRLDGLKLAARTRQALTALPRDTRIDEATLAAWLQEHRPEVGQQAEQVIRETLAVAADQASRDGPVVRRLVGDDALAVGRGDARGPSALLDPRRASFQAIEPVCAPAPSPPRRLPGAVLGVLSGAAGLSGAAERHRGGPAGGGLRPAVRDRDGVPWLGCPDRGDASEQGGVAGGADPSGGAAAQ